MQNDSPNNTDPVLQFFKYKHLPPHLQETSRKFALLAAQVVKTLPRCPERTAALRKLVEAKDCAVRANLPPETVTVSDLE